MATLRQQLQRAQSLNKSVAVDDVFSVIREIEQIILDKNREQLFENSQDRYGNVLGFYSYATEQITHGSKKAGEPFDAYDTGSLQEKMYLTFYPDGVGVFSEDNKAEGLTSENDGGEFSTWLTKDLFGLSEKNLREVIEKSILPLFIKAQRNKLNL